MAGNLPFVPADLLVNKWHTTDFNVGQRRTFRNSFDRVVEQITNRSRWRSGLIVCGGLLRFEFFHRGVEIGRAVMRATDRFDMTAVAERAAVEQASLHDDVVHVVDELGPAIPTRLNIAGGTDVVVGARNMRAVRCPALGDVGRHLVATLFQQREELLKLAGVGRMHRDIEAIGCLHRHHYAVAIGIDDMVRLTL